MLLTNVVGMLFFIDYIRTYLICFHGLSGLTNVQENFVLVKAVFFLRQESNKESLGPLLFSLVLSDLLDDIAKEVAALRLQLWYLNDGTFIGERSSVVSLLHSLLSKDPNIVFALT